MNLVQKLRSLADDITANKNPLQTQRDWDTVGRLLGRTPADPARAAEVVRGQDAAGLDALVRSLEAPEEAPQPVQGDADAVPKETRDAAMKAFKKRLRLGRLSDESRLGGRYTSGGKTSGIDAIQPPEEFGVEVWKALVAEGRLKDTGQGFYALP